MPHFAWNISFVFVVLAAVTMAVFFAVVWSRVRHSTLRFTCDYAHQPLGNNVWRSKHGFNPTVWQSTENTPWEAILRTNSCVGTADPLCGVKPYPRDFAARYRQDPDTAGWRYELRRDAPEKGTLQDLRAFYLRDGHVFISHSVKTDGIWLWRPGTKGFAVELKYDKSDQRCQKNWSPFVYDITQDRELRVPAHETPWIVTDIHTQQGAWLRRFDVRSGQQVEAKRLRVEFSDPRVAGVVRGTTPYVPLNHNYTRWLGITHLKITDSLKLHMTYLSMWTIVNLEEHVVRIGAPFCASPDSHEKIQFISDMKWASPERQALMLGVGFSDQEACIATLPVKQIVPSLWPPHESLAI